MLITRALEALLNPSTQLLLLSPSVVSIPVGTPVLHRHYHINKGLLIGDLYSNNSNSVKICF
jgi:hypothetical protein